jgi:hypothetical protein
MSMSERCLLGAFRVAITSQAVGLPLVCPLYTPCIPPVSNTLACGLALALATSQARNRHYPYPSLLAELMRRGYTPEELKQVAGLNLLRVFREVEKVSARLRRENP